MLIIEIIISGSTFLWGKLPSVTVTWKSIFYVKTDIINSHVAVSILRTVTVKGENGRYVSKNFERPHFVLLSKKIFDTISINIRDEVGDLVAFEHRKVITTLLFGMVLPLTRLNSMGYENKPHNT